jgi:predicted MFS family arabinose efflux permease
LGFISGFSFAVFYSLAALPLARWADRGNRRTVLAVTLAVWSVMTAACGFAKTLGQLAAARFGVGAAEPGALPTAQSLIADYFPPHQRATPIAVINASSAAGYLLGIGLGGYIAATAGWRSVFIYAGLFGLCLAVLVLFFLAEPRLDRSIQCRSAAPAAESTVTTLRVLAGRPSFLWSLIAISTYTIFAYGLNTFVPAMLIRTLGVSLRQISIEWGLAVSVATLVGALLGGQLGDRLGRRDIRWYTWLPAGCCIGAIPFYLVALNARTFHNFIAFDVVAELILSIGIPVSFTAFHVVCGQARRAVAIAIVQVVIMLIGCGLGPLLVGIMSDVLTGELGANGLRYALMFILVFLGPAALGFLLSSRTLRSDADGWSEPGLEVNYAG